MPMKRSLLAFLVGSGIAAGLMVAVRLAAPGPFGRPGQNLLPALDFAVSLLMPLAIIYVTAWILKGEEAR